MLAPILIPACLLFYVQLVPFKVVVTFTLLQLLYLLGVWALITFGGVRGDKGQGGGGCGRSQGNMAMV